MPQEKVLQYQRLAFVDLVIPFEWYVQASEPVRDKKRFQFQYPSLFLNPVDLTAFLETGWLFTQYPVIIWSKKQWQFLYPSPAFFYPASLIWGIQDESSAPVWTSGAEATAPTWTEQGESVAPDWTEQREST